MRYLYLVYSQIVEPNTVDAMILMITSFSRSSMTLSKQELRHSIPKHMEFM